MSVIIEMRKVQSGVCDADVDFSLDGEETI